MVPTDRAGPGACAAAIPQTLKETQTRKNRKDIRRSPWAWPIVSRRFPPFSPRAGRNGDRIALSVDLGSRYVIYLKGGGAGSRAKIRRSGEEGNEGPGPQKCQADPIHSDASRPAPGGRA